VKSKNYSLIDISEDGFVSLMDEAGDMREDIKLPEFPENFGRQIRQKFENAGDKGYVVTVLSAMGHDQITDIKEEVEKK
jgi:translation initiation factor 5A